MSFPALPSHFLFILLLFLQTRELLQMKRDLLGGLKSQRITGQCRSDANCSLNPLNNRPIASGKDT